MEDAQGDNRVTSFGDESGKWQKGWQNCLLYSNSTKVPEAAVRPTICENKIL